MLYDSIYFEGISFILYTLYLFYTEASDSGEAYIMLIDTSTILILFKLTRRDLESVFNIVTVLLVETLLLETTDTIQSVDYTEVEIYRWIIILIATLLVALISIINQWKEQY